MKRLQKNLSVVAAIAILLVTMASISWGGTKVQGQLANKYKAGTASGPVVQGTSEMAAATLSGPSDSQTVDTVPADPAHLIVTEFCSSSATGGIQLSVTDLGFIAQTTVDNLCVTFRGVDIPGGSSGRTITCSTSSSASAGSYACRISGILLLK